jgi:hypothetical protein
VLDGFSSLAHLEPVRLDEFAKLWDYATGELSEILNQDLDDKALNVGATSLTSNNINYP